VRLSREDPVEKFSTRPLRLGIFPVNANPIHWGHLLAGLSAIVNARLDRVVYLVTTDMAGRRDMLPEDLRHDTARELLKSFEPLLCYSPP
jgi:nicotinic acid mononucleotide adenylyltransferase